MRRALLELLAPSVCPACDRPRREGEPLLCAPCALRMHGRPSSGPVRSALDYDGTAALLIRRFKFDARGDALEVLIEPLVESVHGLPVDVIVPVPRHPARIREQGSDPVFVLARALARRHRLPLARNALARSRPTPPQTELPREERLRNVRGSFRARPGALAGRRALLLDDVTTTGATLHEAARELRRAGRPRSITPVALACTPTGSATAVL